MMRTDAADELTRGEKTIHVDARDGREKTEDGFVRSSIVRTAK
jgi:hypothetical protein